MSGWVRLPVCLSLALLARGETAAQAPKPAVKPVAITLPGGFVVHLDAAGAGEAVLLTPEKHRELLEKIERLQAMLDARKPVRPRAIELDGRVEQRGRTSVARIKAAFKFTTTQPNAEIQLGCSKAQTAEAKLDDDKTPLLTAGDTGLTLQVETPGEHTLRLELDLPIVPRGPKGAELGFELDLPGSVITLLTFDAPAKVTRFTLSAKTGRPGDPESEQTDAEKFKPGKGGVPLGAATSLTLSWEDPQRKAEQPRSAETEATVADDEITSEVRYRLRGGGAEWQFSAPANADVSVGRWTSPITGKGPVEFTPDRAPGLVRPEPGQNLWRLQFKEAFAGDVSVIATARTPRPRGTDAKSRGPFPVGPFVALDTATQSGTIRLKTPPNWRAVATLKSNTRRDTTDESVNEPAFRYSHAVSMKTVPTEPALEMTLNPLPGSLAARLRHELRLRDGEWRIRTEIALSPSRLELETIELDVPAGYNPTLAEPRDLVEGVSVTRDPAGRGLLLIRLTGPRRTAFSVTLDGEYAAAGSAAANLELPRLAKATVRETEVLVLAPAGIDVRAGVRTWENGKSGTTLKRLESDPAVSGSDSRGRATVDRVAGFVELTWREAVSSVSVRSVIDAEIAGGRARVTQQLRYRTMGRLPARLKLIGGRDVQGMRIAPGAIEQSKDGWEVIVPADAAGEATFTLRYSWPVPADGKIPLLPPMPDAAHGERTLRVWTPGRATLDTGEAVWDEVPTEPVPDRDSLPALIARAVGPVTPPSITVRSGVAGVPGATVDRMAVMIRRDETPVGYRVRWWVRESVGAPLDLELPEGVELREASVNSRTVGWEEVGSRAYRLRIPRSGGEALLIEARCTLTRTGTISPPRLAGATPPRETLWLIASSVDGLSIVPGPDAGGGWSLDSLLSPLGPIPGLPGRGRGMAEWGGTPAGDESVTFVVVRQTEASPIRVAEVPRQPWLIACSLVALIGGLLLRLTPRRAARFLIWPAIAAGAVLAILMPQPLARAFGAALPGLLTLLALLAVFARLRAIRAWRQTHLPGFGRGGTSMVRPSSARRREVTPAEGA